MTLRRRVSFALILAPILALAAPAFADAPDDGTDDAAALRLYYTGNGLLNRGLHDLAAAEYRRFLKEYPGHEKADVARYGLGVSLYRLEQYEEAIDALSRLTDLDGFQYAAEVLMIRGRSQLALDQSADAAGSFQRVVEGHGSHELADDASALLVEALYHDGRYEEVGAPCRLLIATWPKSPFRERAELFWGLAEMARDRPAEAAQRFGDLRARFPEGEYVEQASLLEAQCLHRTDAAAGAIDSYRRVIDHASDRFVPDAMYGLAALLHEQHQLDASGEVLDELIDRFPEHELRPAATLLRGRVWFDQGEYVDAFRAFSELEKMDESYRDDAAYWLAKCELRQGRPEAADKRLEKALDAFADSELRPEMSFDHAVAELRAGDDDDAVESIEQFLAEYQDHALDPDALQLLAAAHHQEGRYPQSLAACRRFMAAHPDDELAPSVAFLAAENEFLEGQFRQAATSYESFLEKHPDDSQASKARFRLGMTRYHLGEFDEARDLLAGAAAEADEEPTFRPALLALGDGLFQQGEWSEAEQYLAAYIGQDDEAHSGDDALLKLGLARQRQEDLEAAIEAYDRLLSEYPESPHRLRATFEKGQTLTSLGRNDEAVEAFEAVAQSGDADELLAFTLNHLGVIAMQNGEHEKAAGYFEQVVDAGADKDLAARAMFRRGRALLSAEQFTEAASAFESFRSKFPGDEHVAEASAYRAIALSRNGNASGALKEIAALDSTAMSSLPDTLAVAVSYEKAWCLRAENRPDEAMDAYRSVIEKPEQEGLRTHALLELAELEMNAERYADASELLDELKVALDAAKDAPADLRERSAYRRGLCAYRMDDYPRAAEILEAFVKAFPASDQVASASLLCGESQFRTGDLRRAVGHLSRIVEKYPDDEACAPALLRLGECQAQLQMWSESEKAFRDYLDRFGDSELWFQAQFGIGWARENQQRHSEAIDAYRRVVDRHQGETAARAQFQIGECLFAQKRHVEAIRELLKVDILYAYPEWSAAAVYEAGRCFQELGQPAEARKQFRLVRADHPQTKWASLSEQRLEELSRSTLPGH